MDFWGLTPHSIQMNSPLPCPAQAAGSPMAETPLSQQLLCLYNLLGWGWGS